MLGENRCGRGLPRGQCRARPAALSRDGAGGVPWEETGTLCPVTVADAGPPLLVPSCTRYSRSLACDSCWRQELAGGRGHLPAGRPPTSWVTARITEASPWSSGRALGRTPPEHGLFGGRPRRCVDKRGEGLWLPPLPILISGRSGRFPGRRSLPTSASGGPRCEEGGPSRPSACP